MKINSYKDLIVWQKSIDLVILVYKLTDTYPESEIYGLTSQIRRCVVSIPSNIAEGRKHGTKKDFCHCLSIAYGSGSELETQLTIGKMLSFGSKLDYSNIEGLLEEIMKMLNVMIFKLRR